MSIKRVFIANRGEIARRIALGARTLGIESAAIHSGDAPPAFLEGLVDRFIKVPEENPALYLNAELMMQFAQQSECDAVHPGFGFLSENARFASMVEESGLVWVGPTSRSIAEMASKAEAREIARNHKVPVVPGIERLPVSEDGSHLQIVRDFARQHGFPF
jgi:acetyl/propionyl-CoA carboxylase alpha subunit